VLELSADARHFLDLVALSALVSCSCCFRFLIFFASVPWRYIRADAVMVQVPRQQEGRCGAGDQSAEVCPQDPVGFSIRQPQKSVEVPRSSTTCVKFQILSLQAVPNKPVHPK